MIYKYKAEWDFSLLVFFLGGATIISFLLELNFIEIICFDLFVLSFVMLNNLAFHDVEIRLDSELKTIEYVYVKWFKRRSETFKLEEVNYEYKNVFTSAGTHNRFLLKKGSDIIVKPRTNLYSLNIDQIEDILRKLRNLGVKGENKMSN